MKQELTVKGFFDKPDVKKRFDELMGKRSSQFIVSVLQIAAQNSLLAKADPVSIYQSAIVAATLDLPLNQNLGFAYIVPYNTKQADGSYKTVAQFQMGYKGFIQLAQRSGQFKSIYSAPIFEGQIKDENPLEGYVFDFNNKKSDVVIGYAARFKLINGYEATYFMSIEQLKKHGSKYSKTFSNKSGLWNTDFDSMASKTVIKQLLSKFAPLSVEMQKAVVADQGVVNDGETIDVTYIDNETIPVDKELERLRMLIESAVTSEDLMNVKEHLDNYPELAELFETKLSELS